MKVALGVDVSMRGERGTFLYHSRVAQSDAIQAMKLLAYFEKRHDERGTSATAWEAFEAAVFLVADELDSIVFSFRVLTTLLGLM